MKAFLLSTALMIGGVAYAQTVQPEDSGKPIGSGATIQQGTTMGERDTMGANMPAAPTAQDTTTMPPPADSTTGSASGSTMTTTDTAPGSTMGTTDTTTGSTMGTTDTTGTSTMGTTGSGAVTFQQGGNMTPPPEPRAEYPRCSRTVTDNCVQDESRARDTRRTRR